MSEASQRVGHGDLTARTSLKHSEDELGQVTKAFDDMAGELEHKESERKFAEEALRESEEKYRSIFENAVEGIYREPFGWNIYRCQPCLCTDIRIRFT